MNRKLLISTIITIFGINTNISNSTEAAPTNLQATENMHAVEQNQNIAENNENVNENPISQEQANINNETVAIERQNEQGNVAQNVGQSVHDVTNNAPDINADRPNEDNNKLSQSMEIPSSKLIKNPKSKKQSLSRKMSMKNITYNRPNIEDNISGDESNQLAKSMPNIEHKRPTLDNLQDSLVTNEDTELKKLYPNNSFYMFNGVTHSKTPNRLSDDTLMVPFTLTQEICEALKNKDSNKLKRIILNYDKLGNYKSILEHCIDNMVKQFNNQDNLNLLAQYLQITGGKASYQPVSSMKTWLQSQKYFKDIEDIATPILENTSTDKVLPSYELRIAFNFTTEGKSYISIPEIKELPLLIQLQELNKQLEEHIQKRKEGMSQEQLDLISAYKDLQALEKNNIVSDMEKIAKQIKEVENKIKEKTTEKDELQKELNKMSTASNTKTATNTSTPKTTNKSNAKQVTKKNKSTTKTKNTSKPTTPATTTSTVNNSQKITEEKKKIKDQIVQIDKELADLEKQLSELKANKAKLESEYKPIQEKITKAKEKMTTNDEKELMKLEIQLEALNKPIIEILQKIKQLFETSINGNK
ncbi:MAG: hypothetical protein IJ848_04275 [Alphaproteobacteria bacterium]|nr:hypothetical protein [Alphaproteobacteria bacterium]